jgi:hypothetical protein
MVRDIYAGKSFVWNVCLVCVSYPLRRSGPGQDVRLKHALHYRGRIMCFSVFIEWLQTLPPLSGYTSTRRTLYSQCPCKDSLTRVGRASMPWVIKTSGMTFSAHIAYVHWLQRVFPPHLNSCSWLENRRAIWGHAPQYHHFIQVHRTKGRLRTIL